MPRQPEPPRVALKQRLQVALEHADANIVRGPSVLALAATALSDAVPAELTGPRLDTSEIDLDALLDIELTHLIRHGCVEAGQVARPTRSAPWLR